MAAKRSKRTSRSKGASIGADGAASGQPGLDAALAGIAPPDDELDAGFFHRTLARWLGLPEGRGEAPLPVLWSYDFWKAEIVALGSERGRVRFAAAVFRGSAERAERYEYWLELDEAQRIRRSGWATRAPDLTRDLGGFTVSPAPSMTELAGLFHDGPADE